MKKILQTLFFFLLVTQISFAQWVQTNGPTGCDVQAFTICGSNVFMGTTSGFIYRSSDNGLRWTKVTPHILGREYFGGIQDLITLDSIIIVGSYPDTNNCGIFRSTDFGESWEDANQGLNGFSQNQVSSLAVVGNIFFAGTGAGVARSTNNGDYWTLFSGSPSALSLAVNDTILFAGTAFNGVYKSTDYGLSWTNASAGLPSAYILTLLVSGTTLFAGTDGNGVYRSTNNGLSWTATNQGLPSNAWINALSSMGTTLFGGTADNVFRSTNSGDTWTDVSQGLTCDAVTSFGVNGSTLFAGTVYTSGIYCSTNYGDNWVEVNDGIMESNVYCLAGNEETLLSMMWPGIIVRSTDSGESWNKILFDFEGDPVDLAATTLNLFVLSPPHGIYSSSDNGITWVGVNNGLDTTVTSMSSQAQILYAWGYSGYSFSGGCLFQSTNDGETWEELNWPDTLGISALTVCGTSIFASAYSGWFHWSTGHGVFRSTDNGTSWVHINQGLPDSSVNNIATVGAVLFASLPSFGIYRSTNNGDSWTEFNTGLPDGSFVSSFWVIGNNLFASYVIGSVGRIFCLLDNSDHWIDVSEGLPETGLSSLAMYTTNLFVGTKGTGVWKRPLSEMITSIGTEEIFLKEFTLEQNYPNPFNPVTIIKYSIPEISKITLTLFNILGEEVATLVNEEKVAGHYTIKFNGATIPSGIYFYQLKAGNFIQTKKMILLK